MFRGLYGFILKIIMIFVAGGLILCIFTMVGCMPEHQEAKQQIAGKGNTQQTENKALDNKATALAVKNESDQSDSSHKNNDNMDIGFTLPVAPVAPVAPVVPPTALAMLTPASFTLEMPIALDAPATLMCPVGDPDCNKSQLSAMDKVNIEQNSALNAKIVSLGASMNQVNKNMNGFSQLLAAMQNSLRQQAEAARAAIEARGEAKRDLAQVEAEKEIALLAEKEKKWQYISIGLIICALIFLLVKSPIDYLRRKPTA